MLSHRSYSYFFFQKCKDFLIYITMTIISKKVTTWCLIMMSVSEKILNLLNQLSVWLSFQVSIIFLIGIPTSLFFWSTRKRNKAINTLLSNYWKISLLFFISLLLLIGEYNFALIVTNISTLLNQRFFLIKRQDLIF